MFNRRLPDGPRRAVIDIGSNSVRLVIYGGPRRAPAVLFNEKVMAGLGSELADTGRMPDVGVARAHRALDRFGVLAKTMQVKSPRIVATAAVRDASNGHEFLWDAKARGFRIELLSGDQEAEASALGVLSAFPGADGIVADLGGGSLELIRLRDGAVGERVSLPLGVLRIPALKAKGRAVFDRTVATMLREAGWPGDTMQGLPIYLVGGSWRSLARVDMAVTDYPLRVVDAYRLDAERAERMGKTLAQLMPEMLNAIPGLSSARIPTLDSAATLLGALRRLFGPSEFIISAQGLREGLLFAGLDAKARAEDPLLAATQELDRAESRFPAHGRILARWAAPLFKDQPPEWRRLGIAASDLSDVAWRAHPDFRAERGLEMAIHGNWVGIDGAGRAMLGQAIHTCFGGGSAAIPWLAQLAGPEALRAAAAWGLAMRLGQRLSGGTLGPIEQSRLALTDSHIELHLSAACMPLAGEQVEKRLGQLANFLKRKAKVVQENS